MRDWLTSPASGWDRHSGEAPPPLPDEVVEQTRAKYVEAFERLTGETLLMREPAYDAVVPRRWDARVFAAAPRSAVFAYLSDPVNRPEWQASLKRVEVLDAGPPHVGQRWVDHVKVGPRFELQITGLEPDRLWAETGTSGPFTRLRHAALRGRDPDGRGRARRSRASPGSAAAAPPYRWAGRPPAARCRSLVRNDLAPGRIDS